MLSSEACTTVPSPVGRSVLQRIRSWCSSSNGASPMPTANWQEPSSFSASASTPSSPPKAPLAHSKRPLGVETMRKYAPGLSISIPGTSRLWRTSCQTSMCHCGRTLLTWPVKEPHQALFPSRSHLLAVGSGGFRRVDPAYRPTVHERWPRALHRFGPAETCEVNRPGARRASPDSRDGERSRRNSGSGNKPSRLRRHRRGGGGEGLLLGR